MSIKHYGLLHIESGKIIISSYGKSWLNRYFLAIQYTMKTGWCDIGWEHWIHTLELDLGYALCGHTYLEFEIVELSERNLDD